jgi:hypothetical protein
MHQVRRHSSGYRQGFVAVSLACGVGFGAFSRNFHFQWLHPSRRIAFAMLLRMRSGMRSQTLMVRSASSRQRLRCPARVSNHEATDKRTGKTLYRPPNSRSTSQPSNPLAASGRTEAEARVGGGRTAELAETGALIGCELAEGA